MKIYITNVTKFSKISRCFNFIWEIYYEIC